MKGAKNMGNRMYRICLTVPLSSREGTMLLSDINGRIEGCLNLMNEKNKLYGTLSGDGRLNLFGVIQTLVSTVHYTAMGAIKGQKIFLNLKTDAGACYSLTGEECSIDG